MTEKVQRPPEPPAGPMEVSPLYRDIKAWIAYASSLEQRLAVKQAAMEKAEASQLATPSAGYICCNIHDELSQPEHWSGCWWKAALDA